jgi:polyhydroxybutyrate depolymerase
MKANNGNRRAVFLLILLAPAFAGRVIPQTRTLAFGGVARTYIVNVPSSYDGSREAPLLIGLHGYSGTAESSRWGWGLDALSEKAGCIVAYPNALAYPTYQMWNAGGLYDLWSNHTDDVGFIAAMIDTLKSAYRIDPKRIFVTGHSNGGFMAYRVAAELSRVVAAAAPLAGQMVLKDCDPERPVPIIHFHALNDNTVPYDGTVISGMTVPPVEQVIALWAEKNGCSPAADTVYRRNGVVGRQWSSPDHSGDVALYTTPAGLDMVGVMWSFFEAHPMKESGVRDAWAGLPAGVLLPANFPNPFNASTTIPFRVERHGPVTITVLDAAGRNVRTLLNGVHAAGTYRVVWDGRDASGKPAPSGLYACRMVAPGSADVRKMLLVR